MKFWAGIFAVFAAVCAIVLWVLGGRAIAAEAVYPFENAANGAWRSTPARYLRALWRGAGLAKENAELRERAELADVLRMDNARLAAENARLREALEYPAKLEGEWVAAPVLGRNGTEGAKGLMRVGKGSLEGVKSGAPVVAAQGVVGRVAEVTPHTAVVKLLSEPTMKVACEIEGTAQDGGPVKGIVSGASASRVMGDGSVGVVYFVNPYRLSHVRREAVVKDGARLVTSGLGGVFPKGLAIGFMIDGANVDETKLEREGMVKPAV
ncbi:MAG: rod shape-determining protein MreC, partial [Kiritimatiellae bacterium]|nr:rod shape-determining protein MreC [Kiritimatiellia bacterium]